MADNANPFEDAADQVLKTQATAIRQNITQNVGENPDQAAQYQHLAKFVGVPVDTVYAEPDAIKQQAAIEKLDASGIVSKYPHLSQFLTDPNNAAKSHDDVAPLAATEEAVKTLPSPSAISAPPETSGWVANNLKAIPKVPMALAQGLGGSFNEAMKAVDLVAGGFPTLYDKAATLITGKEHSEASDWWFAHSIDPLKANDPYLQLAPDASTLEKVTYGVGNLVGMLAQITLSGGGAEAAAIPGAAMDAVPALSKTLAAATENATKTMAFPAITGAVNSGQQVYEETGDTNAALKAAMGAYATNTAMGVLPVALEGKLATRLVSGVPAGIVTGELNRQVTNATSPDSMQTPATIDDMIVNAITGSILAGSMGHRAPLPHEAEIRQQYQETKSATDAVQAGESIQALSEIATQSALRKRDPQAFRDYIQNMVNDGHTPELYINAETMRDSLAQSGVTPEKLAEQLPEVAQQMQDAIVTNSDVRIPTADYATHIAGGPLDDVLRQHLKVDPNGKTISEGEDYLKNLQQHTEELASTIAEAQPEIDLRKQQLHDVYSDRLQELENAGRFPSDVNRQYATLHQVLVDRLAESEGLSVEDVHKALPLKVVREMSGTPREQLDQGSTVSPDFKKWFGDSKIVDEFGKPLVVYHGTTSDFTEFKKNKSGNIAGYYAAPYSGGAEAFAHGEKGQIMPLYMNLKNPANYKDYKNALKKVGDNPDLLSEYLKSKGFDGYADENELVAFSSTQLKSAISNSGKFDPNNPSILAQGERGFFNPKTGTIGLLKDADLSTFLHETGHHWLETIHDFAARPEASANLKGDFDTLLKWFDVKGDTPEARTAEWAKQDVNGKRDGHEKFAEAFERYLMDGKAPVPELQTLFSRFRSWLMRVYETIRAPSEVLSPEVKSVMDRLFASEQAIAEAERNRSYFEPDFRDGDPKLIEQYKSLGTEATEQAVADMQKRSLRDMQWLSNAKNKAIRTLQRDAKSKRDTIKEEVTKQVMAEPLNQAREALKAAGIKAVSKSTLEIDLIAEQHGFTNGTGLLKDIRDQNLEAKIEGMTDQRMLERHGELVDPTSTQRAAEAAIANNARARQMATGLKILTKSPIPVRDIQKAATEAARNTIAGKIIKDLRPAVYSAAESRSNKELLKLAPKDPVGAANAQRTALLNNRLFKASTDAVNDIVKGVTYLKKFSKETVRAKIDVDIRDQIDDLLARFDLRASPNNTPTRKQVNLEKWIESQMAAGWQPSVTEAMLNESNRKPYREMSVEEFHGLIDTVKSMEHLGRERETLTVNGEKFALADYVNTKLVPRMQERGDKFTTEEIYTRPEDRGQSELKQGLDKFNSWLRALGAQLKGQEFKRNAYDLHEVLGPFGQSLFEPVMQANYRKVDMLKGLSDDFRSKVQELGRDWQKSLTEMIDNKILTDDIATKAEGKPVPFKMSRGKMVGLAVHVGNESNFDKLTKGYNWNPVDVWKFLHDNMTAKDWNAVQTIWDLYEKHWPEQVAMYHRLGQTTPDKIEPRPFKTQFGEMRGGYAAIKYDALRSRRGEKDAQGMAINPNDGLFGRDYFSRNSTTNGAMKSRNDSYTDAIDLNFHTIERAMHESIHDLAYREALINANKIIEQSDFRKQFLKTYGREDYSAIQDWIGRIANAENTDRNVGAFGRFLQYTRTGLVMNAIALRISTVLKHGGSAGIKTMGYFAGGGEHFLTSRMASMTHDYRNQIQGAIEKFPEIRARLLQQDRDYRATASSLFEPESLQSKAERFGHSAVAWADMVTAVPTAWAAYDRAITVGIPKNQGGTGKPMTEAQAVEYGSKIVREAHGSNIESARSNIMTSPSEAVKMFTVLYGFMNNSYGQMADSVNKIRTPGIGNSVVLARTFMAIIIPALWAHYLTHGTAEDNDEGWVEWAAKAVAGEVAGSLPMVREAAQMASGFTKAGVVGAESWMSAMVGAGKDVVRIAQGEKPNRPIANIADAVGMGLHIPGLGQLGKTAQYVSDVNAGKIHPHSTLEYIHDAALGHKEHK